MEAENIEWIATFNQKVFPFELVHTRRLDRIPAQIYDFCFTVKYNNSEGEEKGW